MSLPADNHVHSEWSWDARDGSMERSCAEALRLGLPSIAFTEHLDHTVWTASKEGLADLAPDHPVAVLADAYGRVTPPTFDAVGYLEAIERWRSNFPGSQDPQRSGDRRAPLAQRGDRLPAIGQQPSGALAAFVAREPRRLGAHPVGVRFGGWVGDKSGA